MSQIILLDGGMGQELLARSSLPPSSLWSAQVLMDEPDIVEAVHRDYMAAGAKVLTLNTYSATPERLARDASEDLFEPLQNRAIEICRLVRGEADIAIAGSLPPLIGSYHPENVPDYEICLETYRRIVKQQREAVDVFLCETLSSVREVRAAVTAATESGKPVWCGVTVNDQDGTRLRSGEHLAEAAEAAVDCGATAILINCSWPEAVTQGLPKLADTGLPFGGFANAFQKADELTPVKLPYAQAILIIIVIILVSCNCLDSKTCVVDLPCFKTQFSKNPGPEGASACCSIS